MLNLSDKRLPTRGRDVDPSHMKAPIPKKRLGTSTSVSSALPVLPKTNGMHPRFLDAFFRQPLSILADLAFKRLELNPARQARMTTNVSFEMLEDRH